MNEFEKELISQVNRFCKEKMEPTLEKDEKDHFFRMEIFKELGNLGITGITTSEKYGGAGLTVSTLALVLEEIAKCSVSYAVTVSVSTMAQSILEMYGNEEQKSTYLPSLASGEEIAAFCLSESGSGSDAASLKTKATKVDGGYILNGSKMWITSGGLAKTYIVMARTGDEGASGISAFIVRDGTPGFNYGKLEKKMGWKISPTRELIFDNCFIPSKNLLSNEGMGFKIAASALDKGRITIGSIGVGLGSRALEEAIKYALIRKQFNTPIFDFQGLQWMMSDMAVELEASRLLVKEAANSFDRGEKNIMLASMAKVKATDTAMKVTTDAVQIMGGVGYTEEFPLERYMRDAKVLQIVEGTNQVQKIIIGRELKKRFS